MKAGSLLTYCVFTPTVVLPLVLFTLHLKSAILKPLRCDCSFYLAENKVGVTRLVLSFDRSILFSFSYHLIAHEIKYFPPISMCSYLLLCHWG